MLSTILGLYFLITINPHVIPMPLVILIGLTFPEERSKIGIHHFGACDFYQSFIGASSNVGAIRLIQNGASIFYLIK